MKNLLALSILSLAFIGGLHAAERTITYDPEIPADLPEEAKAKAREYMNKYYSLITQADTEKWQKTPEELQEITQKANEYKELFKSLTGTTLKEPREFRLPEHPHIAR